MIHDPLCEYDEIMFANEKLIIGECSCEVIARARADEREQAAQRVTIAITHTDDDHILWIKARDAVAAARGEWRWTDEKERAARGDGEQE